MEAAETGGPIAQARESFEAALRSRRLVALLTPTTPMLPPQLSQLDETYPLPPTSALTVARSLADAASLWLRELSLMGPVAASPASPITRFTGLCSGLSFGAASVPTGLTEDGLPTALQVAAPAGSELAVLRLAAAYEAARGPLRRVQQDAPRPSAHRHAHTGH